MCASRRRRLFRRRRRRFAAAAAMTPRERYATRKVAMGYIERDEDEQRLSDRIITTSLPWQRLPRPFITCERPSVGGADDHKYKPSQRASRRLCVYVCDMPRL
ncbi:L-2-haloalkanoic acid dehalogenase [Anopheles sinensis]|uniref:L-2-haloalkanoic acid dehalogenase n=1 Tax=Anopheles sinensis TaxID=74873 RepID=A0A084VH06_ANOSI|nr:L-2-haloalkanoic acid dehalogenase [Anopheles sinensis]